jgi:hypothetical protein
MGAKRPAPAREYKFVFVGVGLQAIGGGKPAAAMPSIKTPWPGNPRVIVQSDKGKTKPYQVRQVLLAIERIGTTTRTSITATELKPSSLPISSPAPT